MKYFDIISCLRLINFFSLLLEKKKKLYYGHQASLIWPLHLYLFFSNLGLPWWLNSKESACNAEGEGEAGSIPGSGRAPGGGHVIPLQYSCLENSMDRGTQRATVRGIAKSHASYLIPHIRSLFKIQTYCHSFLLLLLCVVLFFFHLECPPLCPS